MKDTNRMKDKTQAERNSASSISKLVFDNNNDKLTDEPQLNQQQISIKKIKDNSQKIQRISELSPGQTTADRHTFRGPYGISTASTIIWYICICILFIIAFLALVLSIIYFLNDSTTEQVIKLYGITGSGSLAIVTFIIVFLDCCNDGDREDHEAEAIYRILQIKEARDLELAARRRHRLTTEKERKPKPFVNQHQQSHQIPIEPHPHPYYHHYTQLRHIHHIHTHLSTCPVCRDPRASKYIRHSCADIGVDTSDKFEPLSRSKTTIDKSTHDVQTESKLWNAEYGTQTDRTEGTQTSTMGLSGIPKNVTEIIHETTILNAPRDLLPTLKKSMEKQDKDIAINQAVADTNSLTVADV